MKAFNKILKDAKVNSLNRKIARAIFSYKEAAELWFPVEVAEHTKYGFPLQVQIALHHPFTK